MDLDELRHLVDVANASNNEGARIEAKVNAVIAFVSGSSFGLPAPELGAGSCATVAETE